MSKEIDNERIEFAKRLKKLFDRAFEEKGTTNSFIAQQLDVSPGAVSKWINLTEEGTWPSMRHHRLSDILGCSIAYLIKGTELDSPDLLQFKQLLDEALKKKLISDDFGEYGLKEIEVKILKLVLQNQAYFQIIEAIENKNYQILAQVIQKLIDTKDVFTLIHHLTGLINQQNNNQ